MAKTIPVNDDLFEVLKTRKQSLSQEHKRNITWSELLTVAVWLIDTTDCFSLDDLLEATKDIDGDGAIRAKAR